MFRRGGQEGCLGVVSQGSVLFIAPSESEPKALQGKDRVQAVRGMSNQLRHNF